MTCLFRVISTFQHFCGRRNAQCEINYDLREISDKRRDPLIILLANYFFGGWGHTTNTWNTDNLGIKTYIWHLYAFDI